MVNPIYDIKSTTFFAVDSKQKESALTLVRTKAYVISTYNEIYSDNNEPRGKTGVKKAILISEEPMIVALECMWKVQSETPEAAIEFVQDNIASGSKSDDVILQKESVEYIGKSKYKYLLV